MTSPDTPAPPQQQPAVKRPLWQKLALVTALFALLPGALIGLSLLKRNLGLLLQVRFGEQQAALLNLEQVLETSLGQAQTDLHAVARTLGNRDIEPGDRLRLALVVTSASGALDHVDVYGPKGKRIDRIQERDGWKGEAPETLSEEVRIDAQEREIAFGATVLGAGSEPTRVFMVAPIRAKGKLTGFAASHVSLGELQRRLSGLAVELPQFGGTRDSLMVVDRDFKLIAHADPARGEALTSVQELALVRALPTGAFEQRATITREYDDLDGVASLGTFKPLERLPFALIAQASSDVALSDQRDMRVFFALISLLALVGSVIAAVVLARRLTRPIDRLVQHTQALAQRDWSHRVHLATRDELALLGNAMNQAAADIADGEARLQHEAAIRADLGRYLPKPVVERVVRREQDMNLGGERGTISVLFADVVRFTPLTEELPPEDVVAILNQLFTIVTEIVFRHGGTVDKFIGDCVMAFWGAPEPLEDHAACALAAAEDIIHWLEIGNANWLDTYGVTLQLAIGVHSGEAIIGNVGSDTRMEYTAIGETVNIAARLEAIARPQQILTSLATRDLAGDDFAYIDLGPQPLSGVGAPVHILEVET